MPPKKIKLITKEKIVKPEIKDIKEIIVDSDEIDRQDLGNPARKTRELEGLKPSQQDLGNPARKTRELEGLKPSKGSLEGLKPSHIEEGYETITSTNTQTGDNESITTPTTTKGALGKNKKEKDLIANLLSGDFIQYIMDTISDKITVIYGLYDNKYGSGQSNDKESKFNLEENMIPMGFLFFVLSMLIYFVDTTS